MPRATDPKAIRTILETDRAWSVYALADLAPEYSAPAEWHIAANSRPAVMLLYRGFRTPVLFAHGTTTDLFAVLPEVASEPEFYISVLAGVAGMLRGAGYDIPDEKHMWRMVLEAGRFASRNHVAIRLGADNYEELTALYADGEATGERPPFFDAGMLKHGIFFGIRDRRELVAAAGTHVVAVEEGVAAIGNVYTRRDRRGKGYARQLTGAVTGELIRMGVPTIALNVDQSNAPAIHVYEGLGFRRHCDYREGLAVNVPTKRVR